MRNEKIIKKGVFMRRVCLTLLILLGTALGVEISGYGLNKLSDKSTF